MFAALPAPPLPFFALAIACVLLLGVAKAGFGGGVGVLATPLMSLVVSPLFAAGFLLPLLCACDVVSVWHYRRTCDWRSLWMMLPGALVGAALGTLFLIHFRDQTARAEHGLKLMIGVLALVFVGWQVVRGWVMRHASAGRARPLWGQTLGAVAGFGSMIAHAGGPPVTMFLINIGLDRRVFVGTTVWFFAIVNYVKLVPYLALGMINLTSLPLSLMLLPLVPVGVWLGLWLNQRVSQRLFERIIYVILFLTGLQLVTGVDPVALLRRWVG